MTAPAATGARRTEREVRIHAEGALWVVRRACPDVPIEQALARQPALLAPVKLAVAADGTQELRAELLHGRALDVEASASDALARANAWLGGEEIPETGSDDGDDLAAAMAELPRAWAWEPKPEGGHHVHATVFGTSARLHVERRARETRVFVASAVPTVGTESVRALLRFALEANARLRLARVSVEARADAVHFTWDAVASPGVALARGLAAAVEAVAAAHAATRRALRALAHREVAAAYLEAWDDHAQSPPAAGR